jgi:pimeloyl-ACP methyl ester carboxylesterase
LADNVAKVRHALTLQAEPTVLAAHSYGGQVITALGSDVPNVVGLVYVSAFGLDEGESIGALLGQGPPTPAIASLKLDDQGFAWLPEDAFLEHFAPDVDPVEARVMCAVQQPLAFSTLDDVMPTPAWKSLPTWFAVAHTTRSSLPMPSDSSRRGWVPPRSSWTRATPR